MFIGNKVRKIKDSDFLRVKWERKEAAIKTAVHFLNEQAQSRSESKISENFPEYLTFDQAERLFQAIQQLTDSSGEVVIKKLELFHQSEKGKPSNKNEAYAENIQIDSDFVSLLVPLIQSVFSNKDAGFKKASYDEKRAYFERSIFESYIESVGIGREYLPILPSSEDVKLALENKEEIPVTFSQEFPVLVDTTQQPEDEAKNDQVSNQEEFMDVFDDPVEEAEEEVPVYETEFENIPESEQSYEELEPVESVESEGTDTQYSEKVALPPTPEPALESATTSVPALDPHPITVASPKQSMAVSPLYEFPMFEVVTFSKAKYEPYEDEYVAWKLNEFKKEFNQQLQQRGKLTQEYSSESIRQKLLEFEKVELANINAEVQATDDRYTLKEKVVSESRAKEATELKQKGAALEKEKADLLEQENQRHKQRVEEIKVEFESKHHEARHVIHQKYFDEAKRHYQEQMLEATSRLEMLVRTKLNELEERLISKEEALHAEQKELARQIGDQLFVNKQDKLERIKPFLVSEHEFAKKKHLIDEEKMIDQKEREDTLKNNELLRGQIKDLMASHSKSESDKLEGEKRLLEEKEKSLAKQAELVSKMQAIASHEPKQDKDDKSVKNAEPKKKRTLKSVLLATVTAIIMITAGWGFYQYQVNQHAEVQQMIQKVVAGQKKTDKDLQSQRAAMSSQSAKSESESRKKAESESQKRISELEKELSDLKSKTQEQSSAQNTSEKN